MSFIRPTLPELVEQQLGEIEARLPGSDARLRHSNLNVLGRVQAGAQHQFYGYLSWLALQLFPDTCEAEFLDRWASIWLVDGRKGASLATGEVRFSGTAGSTIPAATALTRADGTEYLTMTEATIGVDGTVNVNVAAVVPGLAGNTEVGTSLTITTPIAGVQGIATVQASGLTQGSDAESDEALRSRVVARIQSPPHGGAAADYVTWALEVPGVTRAWCLPNYMGPGTVGVLFVCDDRGDPIPDAQTVETVRQHIDRRRPVTAIEIYVMAPVARPVAYTIRLVPGTVAVKTAVIAALLDLHARECVPGQPLWISHIREAISGATGETDSTVLAPTGDVLPSRLELPVYGGVTWQ